MKKELLRVSILCSIVAFSFSAKAQQYIEKKIIEKNGSISFVAFKNNASLRNISKADLFKNILKLSQDSELRLAKSENDFTGYFLDEKYQQFYKGIVIEFGTYNLHYKKGQLTSMNGEVFSTDNVSTTASISKEIALQKAIESVSAQEYMWDAGYGDIDYNKKPAGELVLLPIAQQDESFKLVLAYKFDIFAAQPISRANIYINAANGEVLLSDPIMKHSNSSIAGLKKNPLTPEEKDESLKISILKLATGNAETRYSGAQSIETSLATSGSNYILHDTTRGGGVRTFNLNKGTNINAATDFTDVDNNWTATEFDNSNFDNAALDAHWGVEKTYDYFKEKFNRNSYNNLGTLLRSYIHYSTSYENAGWTGSYMIYGDGATQFSPLTAFDVTAHELGHGVCSTTAALAYQRESGALNEGFSDIWGAAVEYEYAPNKQAFLIGEDIAKTSPYYLRSMSNPKSALQPDTYRGQFWVAATTAEGCITPGRDTNDYCGVHTNSGVLNHWFYILVQGKIGTNDIGKSYNVTGIGFDKAAKIAYRLETTYLTPNSNFINTRNFGIQAAIDLYGANSAEVIATQDAFYAVGLGSKYNPNGLDTTVPTTPINLSASSTTNTATYLTWTESTDNFALDGYNVYRDNILIGSTYNNSYYAKGLTASTAYKFKVEAKDEAGNKSDFSNEVTVNTLDSGATYCTSTANDSASMRIKNVTLNTINNSSTATIGYEDYSYLSTDVKKGNTYTITITPDRAANYSMKYSVYVDYDNSGTFTQTGETVWSRLGTTASPVSGTFTIPTTVAEGKVRMRVIGAYSSSTINSCNTYTYGQTEDYTLNIIENLAVSEINNDNKVSIYPNPVKDVLNIKTKESGDSTYKIFNTAGQSVANGKSVENKIDVNRLPTGNYVIELVNKKGEKSTQKFIKK